MTVWSELRDDLLDSELAFDAVLHPQPPGSPAVTGLRVLMPGRDRESAFGQTRTTADLVTLQLSRAAVTRIEAEDQVEVTFETDAGSTARRYRVIEARRYRVIEARPADDDPELWWTVRAEGMRPRC